MSSDRFDFGDVIKYEARFEDGAGAGITNAAGKINIRRKSDDTFWTGFVWQAAPFEIIMDEISDANVPGQWKFDFDTAPHLSVDQYVASISDSSGNAVNRINQQLAYVGETAANDELKRLLGLSHENFVFDPLTYDTQGRMITGVVRCYDSKANADTDDNSTGILYRYDVDSVRTIEGFLGKFTQTRTL